MNRQNIKRGFDLDKKLSQIEVDIDNLSQLDNCEAIVFQFKEPRGQITVTDPQVIQVYINQLQGRLNSARARLAAEIADL